MPLPELLQPFKSLITTQVPLADFCYMKVGGPADYLAVVTSNQDLISLVKAAYRSGIRFLIVGGGSNLIFSDSGYRGLVIINRTNSLNINNSTGLVRVDGGVIINALINKTINLGLSGLEVFLGVPGSVGGAVYNNSHYLNRLIGDYVSRVRLFTPDTEPVWVDRAEMDFAYDFSRLHRTGEILVEVEFQLESGHDTTVLFTAAKAALTKRTSSQPLTWPSSGCMFQNPPMGLAGKLIDQAGLKGLRIGGAEVSQVHANFIINTGRTTAADIIALSGKIIETIREKYGITLKREVFILDEYGERISS